MYKLLFTNIPEETISTEDSYKPPTYYIDLNIIPFGNYELIIDPYTTYLLEQEMLNTVFNMLKDIRRYVEDANDRITTLNQKQITLMYANIKNEDLDYDLIDNYRNNIIRTNKGDQIWENTKKITDKITGNINKILTRINNKNDVSYTLYNGDLATINDYIEILTVENKNRNYEN